MKDIEKLILDLEKEKKEKIFDCENKLQLQKEFNEIHNRKFIFNSLCCCVVAKLKYNFPLEVLGKRYILEEFERLIENDDFFIEIYEKFFPNITLKEKIYLIIDFLPVIDKTHLTAEDIVKLLSSFCIIPEPQLVCNQSIVLEEMQSLKKELEEIQSLKKAFENLNNNLK